MTLAPTTLARVAVLGACAVLTACGTFDQASRGLAERLTPYRVEVVQGNFVSREQADALRPGMTRLQVRDLLGSPLLTSVFHADRWDYVFTLQRPGQARQSYRLSVFFQGDGLVRHESDTLPSENEFAARFAAAAKAGKVPPLEASEESLKAFSARHPPAAAAASAAQSPATVPAPARTSYPPLEPAR